MSYGSEIQEYEAAGGEIVQASEVPLDALGSLTRAEIDSQIATAKRFPRSVKKFMDDARSLACLTPEVAQSCIYALPRGGKPIEGPSVRLAEVVAHTFGNLRVSARITQETGSFIVAQAVALDLEKNNGVQVEVRRRITDRNGRRFNDDMITLTCNAALSIAYRNAVFKAVPAAFVQPIYREARKLAAGGGKSIEERRKNIREWIGSIGVKPDELFQAIGVRGWEDIGLEQMAVIAGLMTAIKDGDASVDDVFRPSHAPKDNALPAPSKADSLAADLASRAPSPAAEAAVVEPTATSPRKGKLFPES